MKKITKWSLFDICWKWGSGFSSSHANDIVNYVYKAKSKKFGRLKFIFIQ